VTRERHASDKFSLREVIGWWPFSALQVTWRTNIEEPENIFTISIMLVSIIIVRIIIISVIVIVTISSTITATPTLLTLLFKCRATCTNSNISQTPHNKTTAQGLRAKDSSFSLGFEIINGGTLKHGSPALSSKPLSSGMSSTAQGVGMAVRGLKVWGWRLGVEGLGLKVWGWRFGVEGLGLKVWGW
jgi:hypothetical protein